MSGSHGSRTGSEALSHLFEVAGPSEPMQPNSAAQFWASRVSSPRLKRYRPRRSEKLCRSSPVGPIAEDGAFHEIQRSCETKGLFDACLAEREKWDASTSGLDDQDLQRFWKALRDDVTDRERHSEHVSM